MATNSVRIRILADIDDRDDHSSTVSRDELARGFNHVQHWWNWAKAWQLICTVSDDGQTVRFVRRPGAMAKTASRQVGPAAAEAVTPWDGLGS